MTGKNKKSSEEESLHKLVVKREQLFKQLKKFNNFLNEYTDTDLAVLKVRIEKIEPLLGQVSDIELEISVLDDKVEITDDFEESYYKVVAEARKRIANSEKIKLDCNEQHIGSAANMNYNTGIVASAKLPNIGIPKFQGEYEKWTQFQETFNSLIDSNPCLDNIQKFYYLLDALEGDAKRILDSLEITRDNYHVAWQLLENRYNNKPVIVQAHLKNLFDSPMLTEQSHALYRKFLDTIERNVRALKALKEPVEHWDKIIIFFMTKKLDRETKEQWEGVTISEFKGDPSLKDFIGFLDKKCRVLESVEINSKPTGYSKTNKGFQRNVTHSALYGNKKIQCQMCKGSHFIYKCEKLLGLSVAERKTKIKELKLCLNCLRSNHFYNQCRADGCKKCGERHNSMLCTKGSVNKFNSGSSNGNGIENSDKNQSNVTNDKVQNGSNAGVVASSVNCARVVRQGILSTAVVYIKDSYDKLIKCRALLDCGSQMNFISQDLVQKLKLKTDRVNIPISGVSQMTTNITKRTNTVIKSVYNDYKANLSFLVLKNVTSDIPVQSLEPVKLEIPANLKLADPEFEVMAKIDVLIGASIFFELLSAGQLKLNNGITLQKTVLGWIVSGTVPENGNSGRVCHVVTHDDIHDQIEKFWSIEELPIKKLMSREESECEQNFINSTTRDESGRFIVTLPVKETVKKLGNSVDIATKRFFHLERNLLKDVKLKEQYQSFMKEYLELGHMTKVENHELDSGNNTYYLPHHCVINEASETTKVRVVFDASCKTSSDLSLNDILKIGPNIQDELFDILIRFRQYNVVVTADIAKMYRQINIVPEQRDLQRIVWRFNSDAELEHYRLNTVTYGTAPASYIATRCLKQIALDIGVEKPELSKIINENFYVDDLIAGASSAEAATMICKGLAHELNKYGLPLRKWSSNNTTVLENLAKNDTENIGYFITNSDEKKTLGIMWKPNVDTLEYVVKLKSFNRVTKRLILSIISQIFDPLGLVGPVTIKAKILLQNLWKMKLTWDESIPLALWSSWQELYNHLSCLNKIIIPRQSVLQNAVKYTLVGFCDASEAAYGATLYLRSENAQGKVMVRLLCAKSRVAPLKSLTLPRLELCGALLLARLTSKVLEALTIEINKIFLWTDSKIVLSWLSKQPSVWNSFVANRVAEIQTITKNHEWGHVISVENPADIISRGVNPNQLSDLKLWWTGPEWLLLSTENWSQTLSLNLESVPEKRKVKLAFLTSHIDFIMFSKFSSLFKLRKVFAYCLRFVHNVRKPAGTRDKGRLTVEELDRALSLLIKIMQRDKYYKEIKALHSGQTVSNTSSIRSLDPFLDKADGLLRVGGRISRSDEKYATKFPIILPQGHPLTNLIILEEHHKNLHAGNQAILSSLRQKFWPVNGRRNIRSVLSKCVTCFRIKPLRASQKMGDLPRDRLVPQRPFAICGVDFAGPFNLRDGKLRNRKIVKGYMCLFICFTTKAVHIELVGDLTTNAFLNCLKRFISRRGICYKIYSDNGTNFIGCNNKLKAIFKNFVDQMNADQDIQNYCLKHEIRWQYIPPRSPHQGGLWEAAIKSAKYHVTRVIGNNILTFEDMSTLFTQVEATLNSRPITPMSSDPHDLIPLTPGHFLIGDSLKAIPQMDVTKEPINHLNHYQELQRMYQRFWSRWSFEYLTSLQTRMKWQRPSPNIEVGSMVLLKDESVAPLHWKLGRVLEVHPGADQLIRTVSVITNGGVVKRAIQNICVLPVEPENAGE